jgi:hypothetical protein
MFLDFRDLVNARDGIRVPQHLQRFKAYADVYESFDGFPADSREGLFFYRLDEMDTSTVFPLLLEIFRRQPNAGNTCERDQILTDLESFLVRRVVCGLSAKGYNRLFGQFASKLRANNDDFSAAAIRKELTAEITASQRWPDDDEFRHAWMTIDFYKRVKKSIQRMILEAIEATLHTGKTEKVRIERKLTIEHLISRENGKPIGQSSSANSPLLQLNKPESGESHRFIELAMPLYSPKSSIRRYRTVFG